MRVRFAGHGRALAILGARVKMVRRGALKTSALLKIGMLHRRLLVRLLAGLLPDALPGGGVSHVKLEASKMDGATGLIKAFACRNCPTT